MESAVYARQSVEKKNSLSIDGQIDLCRRNAGQDLKVYQDKGFSGKNTQRPDFQRLMRDIREDRIDKLYVYRLDRFSRSVADFGNLWNTLQEHRVEFVSVSENFDTSTPMGRAMLHIIMVFAQLERETTAERVRDNYYKRASLGSWPGGPAPYGFAIGRRHDENGRMCPTLLIEPEHAQIVKRIFHTYAQSAESLGSVAKKLNKEGIAGPKRDTWDNVSLSRILRCPAYVMADEQVRLHYLAMGVKVTSETAAFDGRHGLLLIGKRDKVRRKYTDACEQSVSVLNSEGFVDASLWLLCQNKLSRNHQLGNSGRGTHTWLSGLLKCAVCGYSLKVSVSKSGRYLNCSGRYNLSKCTEDIRIGLPELESSVAGTLQSLLDDSQDKSEAGGENDRVQKRLCELDRKADRVVSAFSESDDVTDEYLHRALSRIIEERNNLMDEIKRGKRLSIPTQKLHFAELPFEDKKIVAAQFIEKILISGEEAVILWKA